jgi:hypothetical protein
MLTGRALDFSEIALEKGEKKKTQEFRFNNVISDIRFVGKKTFVDSFLAEAYGGRLLLRGYTYFNRNVRHSRFLIGMENVGLKDTKITYPVPCKVSGMVSGDIDIKTNKDNTYVKGIMTASGLDLSGLELLDKVADFIGIKSIKEINGADFAVGFDLSPEKSVIEQFDLDSPEMSIRSNFRIDQKQWLEGEIALGLPRKVLEESKIFKKLIAMARERQRFLDFVVHLSGYSWQLRTELVKSDLRDKLREKTAAWIQNRIEREVNKAIEEQGD